MKAGQEEGARQSCKKAKWEFRLNDGMRKFLFRRRDDGSWVPTYDTHRGDIFYNGLGGAGRKPEVRGDDATLSIQVLSALPGKEGEVRFQVSRISSDRTYTRIGSARCTQAKFLTVLRDGIRTTKKEQ